MLHTRPTEDGRIVYVEAVKGERLVESINGQLCRKSGQSGQPA